MKVKIIAILPVVGVSQQHPRNSCFSNHRRSMTFQFHLSSIRLAPKTDNGSKSSRSFRLAESLPVNLKNKKTNQFPRSISAAIVPETQTRIGAHICFKNSNNTPTLLHALTYASSSATLFICEQQV